MARGMRESLIPLAIAGFLGYYTVAALLPRYPMKGMNYHEI